MIETGQAIALGFAAGYVVALLINREPPKIEATLVVDKEALHHLNLALVNAWLEQHGMTWQPKGAVFDPGKEIKK